MSAHALKSGLEYFFGKRRSHRPLPAVLQHLMTQPTGSTGNTAAPLAGWRILVACETPTLAESLRQGGAEVRELRPGSTWPEELRGSLDAIVLALDAPAHDALAAARAVRACGDAGLTIPILGLATDPAAFAEAATAAGINGLLGKPVETTLLYETLTRFITAGAARAQRSAAAAPALATSVVPEALLNMQRLDSYKRLGMLDELVNDYLPEMSRLLVALDESAARSEAQGSLAALHSLLGMSGEAGAQALYQHVRQLYVPLLEHGQWPPAVDWVRELRQLAARTEEALKAYCAQQARSSAA